MMSIFELKRDLNEAIAKERARLERIIRTACDPRFVEEKLMSNEAIGQEVRKLSRRSHLCDELFWCLSRS